MSVIILIVVGLVILIAGVLIYAFFKTKSVLAEAEIIINRPVHEVYTFLSHLKNQDLYSKIRTTDPKMIRDFKGIDGTVGFIYAWSSEVKEVGIGEQEIIRLVPDERIETQIRFKKPFASNDPSVLLTKAIDSASTRVTMSYIVNMNYPTNIFLSVFENKVKKMMTDNLLNAKSLLEK